MATEFVIPEAYWPALVIGGVYRLKPTDTGGQWVEIVDIEDGIVSVRGVDGHIMDQDIPIERFYNVLARIPAAVVVVPPIVIPDPSGATFFMDELGNYLVDENGDFLVA